MNRVFKKWIAVFAVFAISASSLMAPATAQAASKKKATITTAKISSVYVGSRTSLKVKTNTKCKVSYKVSDKKTAKVNGGKLYAYKAGKVTVTITANPVSKKYRKTTKKITVKILPAKTSASVKRSGNYIIASAKKAKGAKGYQFRWSSSKNMTDPVSKCTGKTSYKFKASASKTWYVQVRSYAKAGKKTYCSGWSHVYVVKGSTPASAVTAVPTPTAIPTATPTDTPVPTPSPTPEPIPDAVEEPADCVPPIPTAGQQAALDEIEDKDFSIESGSAGTAIIQDALLQFVCRENADSIVYDSNTVDIIYDNPGTLASCSSYAPLSVTPVIGTGGRYNTLIVSCEGGITEETVIPVTVSLNLYMITFRIRVVPQGSFSDSSETGNDSDTTSAHTADITEAPTPTVIPTETPVSTDTPTPTPEESEIGTDNQTDCVPGTDSWIAGNPG